MKIDLSKVIAAGKKQTQERKSKGGKNQVVWSPEELDAVTQLAKVCLSGELSKAVLGAMYKQARSEGKNVSDYGIDKSYSAFSTKLDELYKTMKGEQPTAKKA